MTKKTKKLHKDCRENFIRKLLSVKDQKSLDLILMLIYSLPSYKFLSVDTIAERKHRKNVFRKLFFQISDYNLQLKYEIDKEKVIEIFQKIKEFIDYILEVELETAYSNDFGRIKLNDHSTYPFYDVFFRLLNPYTKKGTNPLLIELKNRTSKLESQEKKLLFLIL